MQNTDAVNSPETNWQVEVGGELYEASFGELTEWIAEGSLQPEDKVRRGNLRWLEANKIPSLHKFFNAAQSAAIAPPVSVETSEVVSADENEIVSSENSAARNFQSEILPRADFGLPEKFETTQNHPIAASLNNCSAHPNETANYVCTECAKVFCAACPKSFGSVKICPACGAMCKSRAKIDSADDKKLRYERDLGAGFGLADFGRAAAYPFKFGFSLISGALLFMFFTLGQSAWALGGIFLIVAAIFCAMLANTLTFGILANTVENFSHGRTGVNFMPPFEDFNLWDDVIHPFFLSLAAYFVSFGLLIILLLGGMYFAGNSSANGMESPGLSQFAANTGAAKNVNQSTSQGALTVEDLQASRADEAKKIEELEKQISRAQEQSRREQLAASAPNKVLADYLKAGKIFVLLGVIALIWGAFYFPAACAVAGYTRSFRATLNPLVGLDTIKRLGADYLKILLFSLLILGCATLVNYLLSLIFAPFDLPQIGNLAVKAAGSLFAFYFSTVFSVTLGFALYKNSDKLNLKIA